MSESVDRWLVLSKRRGLPTAFLEVFFNIADALDIDPADLINASIFPDQIRKNQG